MQQLLDSVKTFLKKYWLPLLMVGFVLSRLYTFLNPPPYVRYFEEYANIWYYGWPPYLKHLYEYPPATLPFVSAPLYLDLAGIGKYRMNFRIMMLVVDALSFGLVLWTMRKMKYPAHIKFINGLFYLLLTTKAKDFMYENLDPIFALTFFVPTILPLIITKTTEGARLGAAFFKWVMYWFGTGLKLVNAPLGLMYFFAEKPYTVAKAFKTFLLIGVAGAVIWAAPVLYFRSSLSVVIIYHKDRVVQVESLAGLIIRGANLFTHSEEMFFSKHKSFDMQGPISDKMLMVSNVSLVISMLALLAYIVVHRDKASNPVFMMKVTLIFIFSYFLTNKVFSTPYHLWYLALLTVYPYRSHKERAFFFTVAAIFMSVAMSPIPSIEVVHGFFLNAFLPVVTQIPATLLLFFGVYNLKTEESVKEVALVDQEKADSKAKKTKDRRSK